MPYTSGPTRPPRFAPSSYQWLIYAITFLIVLIDGYDTQAVSFAAPALREEIGGDHAALGALFSAGLFGGLVGGLVFGPLGDRIGRKPILLISLAIMAAGSFATAFANGVDQLSLLRFLTGIGLGGAIPGVIATAAEYAPRGRRSLVVALVFSGFPLGAVAGSITSALVLAEHGWRLIFIIGAIAPALLLLATALWLPESLALLERGGDAARARALRVRERLGARGGDLEGAEEARHYGPRGSVLQLFTEGRAAGTALIWTICFLSLLCTYGIVSWIPTLVREAGLPIEIAVLSSGALNIGSIFGNLMLARLGDRIPPFTAMATAYFIGALFVGAIGFASTSSTTMLLVCFAAGLFTIGAQLSVTAVVAAFYPTRVRATGIGWSFGIGRFGGVVGPTLAGLVLAQGASFEHFMMAVGAVSAAAGCGVLALSLASARASARAPAERIA
ncbi:MFS transporter [Terricaulis silvestris]|uniref:4-hydroxybenzoate transporter PcaK n=1 Tax=Terricaulis silvestris TaxID=2686094 RepID=A0A6I6MLF2_9CAUL|nr:MFS transporter [Terricaulis silvestris]QGZ93814.1 4-hydroxybenzoate transporter PcaK [Terricaulis silvestris]